MPPLELAKRGMMSQAAKRSTEHAKIHKTSSFIISPRTGSNNRDFSAYQEFAGELQSLADAPLIDEPWIHRVDACLGGSAGSELCRLVRRPARREVGAFFTSFKLADRLLSKLIFNLDADFIYDPAVGAGDLLLAVARRLPLRQTLAETLESWGACLAGTDLQAEFVEVAKLRIALLARQRHGLAAELPNNWQNNFSFLRLGDGLSQPSLYSLATHIVMNPPFSMSSPIVGCDWAGGRVSDAAIFIVRALEHTEPGTRLRAILPEVLRSGSLHNRWRDRVSNLAEILSVRRYGIFDKSTDIDVFLLDSKRRDSKSSSGHCWPKFVRSMNGKVGEHYDVHVGRVVPHRDPEEGPEHPYIHPRCVSAWKVINKFSEKRRHKGVCFEPPFVVIRRTSRPGHKYRATATVISGSKPIAVENHFIVCTPKHRTLNACRKLMRLLKTHKTNEFLNSRICCRHLTVSSLREIPWEEHK